MYRFMVWVYAHAEIIECVGKKGNANVFQLSKTGHGK